MSLPRMAHCLADTAHTTPKSKPYKLVTITSLKTTGASAPIGDHMSKEAMKLALEALEAKGDAWIVLERKAKAAIREALAEQPAQGCDYCNHPQYAGTKCKNCGREQPAQQEPVAMLPEVDICMRAEAHGIDASTPGLYGFYVDCMSSSPQPAQHLPDVIHHTDTSETLEYISGWNDCREAMKGMK